MNDILDFWKSMWVTPAVWWELTLVAIAFTGAALVRRAGNHQLQELRWKLAAEAFHRVFFPVISLLVVTLGQIVLHRFHQSTLLLTGLIIPALVTMAAIRLLVYMLRYIFGAGAWVVRSEKYLFWGIWSIFVMHLTGVLPELVHLLDSVGIQAGKTRITPLLVVNAVLSLVAIVLVTLWLSSLVEKRIMLTEALELNLRVVLSRVARILLLVVGMMVLLPILGIDLTALSVFSGAVGVGIGFGLQKIASNYVSGFILLLDRSIRIGDIINVNGQQGRVQRLTSRYAVLSGGPGTPATIIPTDTLITSTVVNMTFSERRTKLVLPVQIAYDSDLEVAERCLLEAARAQPQVMADPGPAVFLKAFAASGIDLEMSLWINDPDVGELGVRSAINRAIWSAFKREGIEIPYSRLDVRMIETQ